MNLQAKEDEKIWFNPLVLGVQKLTGQPFD